MFVMNSKHGAHSFFIALAFSFLGTASAWGAETKPSPAAENKRPQVAIKAHKSVQAKHSVKKIAYAGKTWFVPPPPPYTPSMLPELQYSQMTASPSPVREESAEDLNPYSKYIYTRSGYDAPRRVQPNKYVTVWTNKT
jgi:hypothetical protein